MDGESSEARVAETVAVVMRIIRDRQPPEAVVSSQTAWLVRQTLSLLAAKENKQGTVLRVSPSQFAAWASRLRDEIHRFEKQ